MPGSLHKMCAHCGSIGERRIGYCHSCEGPVCEKCGNSHITRGQERVLHDSCLKDSGDSSFSMIKFVR